MSWYHVRKLVIGYMKSHDPVQRLKLNQTFLPPWEKNLQIQNLIVDNLRTFTEKNFFSGSNCLLYWTSIMTSSGLFSELSDLLSCRTWMHQLVLRAEPGLWTEPGTEPECLMTYEQNTITEVLFRQTWKNVDERRREQLLAGCRQSPPEDPTGAQGAQCVLPSSRDSTPESEVLAASFCCRFLITSCSSEPKLIWRHRGWSRGGSSLVSVWEPSASETRTLSTFNVTPDIYYSTEEQTEIC